MNKCSKEEYLFIHLFIYFILKIYLNVPVYFHLTSFLSLVDFWCLSFSVILSIFDFLTHRKVQTFSF